MPPKAVTTVRVSDDPQVYEAEHVHAVYDEIAPHFSSTRYKPWPIIAQFLSSIPSGWVGLDSGTGNGKYLPLPIERPGSVWTIGLDRSRNLLDIARTAGGVYREVVWGDVLCKPWRDGVFDYTISIATVHHLSTHARRKLAVQVCSLSSDRLQNIVGITIQRLIQCLSPDHGRALIYVWAIEQDELSKRSVPSQTSPDDTPHQDPHDRGQDVFVPWVLSTQNNPAQKSGSPPVGNGRTPESPEDAERGTTPRIYNRYYHMFAQGELAGLVTEAAQGLGLHVGDRPAHDDQSTETPERGIEIVQNGWERSNYYVEFKCWQC